MGAANLVLILLYTLDFSIFIRGVDYLIEPLTITINGAWYFDDMSFAYHLI